MMVPACLSPSTAAFLADLRAEQPTPFPDMLPRRHGPWDFCSPGPAETWKERPHFCTCRNSQDVSSAGLPSESIPVSSRNGLRAQPGGDITRHRKSSHWSVEFRHNDKNKNNKSRLVLGIGTKYVCASAQKTMQPRGQRLPAKNLLCVVLIFFL